MSLPVLSACAAATLLAGFGVAWLIETPAETGANAVAAGSAPAGAQTAGVNQNPWGKVGTVTASQYRSSYEGPAVMDAAAPDDEKLRRLAQSDPAVLRTLIQNYDKETDPGKRESVRAILSTVDSPEAQAFFARLAASNDAVRRQEGFQMLQNASESPQVRGILKQALATEQTPAILVQAISAMKPVALDAAESEAIVGQLRGLTGHADPAVRSQSLLQLGQWDKNGAGQDRYAQGLNDPAPQVRQAAIFAIAQSGVRTDALKAGLMGMIKSPDESREVKGSALQALERFSLSNEELASFNQVRSKIGG